MTVTSSVSRVDYVGNAVLGTYPYPFKIFADGDLDVYVGGALQVLNINYTVTGAGDLAGGNVIFTVVPGASVAIAIIRMIDITQETDYVELDKFPAETHEDAIDKGTMIDQQLNEGLGRSLKFGINSGFKDVDFPSLVASKFVQVNAGASGFQLVAGTPVASASTFLDGSEFQGMWYDSSTYADINAAVTAIGATPSTLMVSTAETLSANITFPSTLSLVVIKGGSIVAASTYTCTINGPFAAGNFQVFSGFASGKVTFAEGACKEVIPKWFGTTGDGTADDTVPLQSAITAAAAIKRVYIPAGIYKTSAELVIATTDMKVIGSGSQSCQIVGSNLTQNIFNITAASFNNIEGILINSSVVKSAGAGIYVSATADRNIHSVFRELVVTNQYNGIYFNSAAFFRVEDCFIGSVVNIGIYVKNAITADEGDSHITGCVITQTPAEPGGTGIWQIDSGGLRITNNKILYFDVGIMIDPTGSSGVTIINNNSIENQDEYGIVFQRTAGAATWVHAVIDGNQFANQLYAAIGQSSASWLQNLVISNNVFFADQGNPHLVYLNGVDGAIITGNIFDGNSAGGDYVGVYIGALCTNVTVTPTNIFKNMIGNVIDLVPPAANVATAIDLKGMANIMPYSDANYYLGRNDALTTPLSWKGLVMKDTTNGKYYLIQPVNGAVTATEMTTGLPTPSANLLLGWTNTSYDAATFRSVGPNINPAISTGATAKSCASIPFWVTDGVGYTITATLTLNSGEAPTLSYTRQGLAQVDTVLAAGANVIPFTAVGNQMRLAMSNTIASNWACTFTFLPT